jgi:hypothetical protein
VVEAETETEKTVRLMSKEPGLSSKWLQNEGLSSYEEAAMMFEGAAGAVERKNELPWYCAGNCQSET